MLSNMLWVSLGAVLGANARYLVSVMMVQYLGKPGYWATFSVNVIGSFLLGLVAGFILGKLDNTHHYWFLIAVGGLGSFTTFSTFSLDMLFLIQQQQVIYSILYAAVSIITGLIFVYLGWMLSRLI
ncbi:fluoride efflux transporter CrcB [Litoribrevibacter euphylliae]|uniref:Fluoride-specific ion channel FluC n=1 Tax=Litoribrevibacter euphylliae TaxID=1834034 RepID=A0ABV7HJE0_9GAMM